LGTNIDYAEAKALDRQHNFYMDEKDFFAQFMFKPDIQELADFAHLDKNLATTRLSSKYAEPERARSLLTALHVLNNILYYKEIEVTSFDRNEQKENYRQLCECGQDHILSEPLELCVSCGKELPEAQYFVVEVPIFVKKKIKKSLYPKTYHSLKAAFYSLTTTAAAREGHLMRAATSTHILREDSIEERSDSRKSNPFVKNSNYEKRY